MKKTVQLLNSTHAEQFQSVLRQSYAQAHGFTTRPEATRWSSTEEYYPTLGVLHGEQLVSVMRLEWVHSHRELNFKLAANFHHPNLTFPAAYLTKAGTLPSVRGGGFNSLLRYYSLKIAIAWGVRYMFGTMVEGSPRVFTLQEMGYQFVKNPEKWNGYFVSDKTPLIAWLDLQAKGNEALSYLEKSLKSVINDYTVEFDVNKVLLKDDKGMRFPWSA